MWYAERNLYIIVVIILLGLLLMAVVTWLFDKRIRGIEEKKPAVVSLVGLPENYDQLSRYCDAEILGVL
jgi:hypothetical protein